VILDVTEQLGADLLAVYASFEFRADMVEKTFLPRHQLLRDEYVRLRGDAAGSLEHTRAHGARAAHAHNAFTRASQRYEDDFTKMQSESTDIEVHNFTEFEVHEVEMTDAFARASLEQQVHAAAGGLAATKLVHDAHESAANSDGWHQPFADFTVDYHVSSEITTIGEAAAHGTIASGVDLNTVETDTIPYHWAADVKDVNIEGMRLHSTILLPVYVVDYAWHDSRATWLRESRFTVGAQDQNHKLRALVSGCAVGGLGQCVGILHMQSSRFTLRSGLE
jgi:hypothetical protein